MHGGFSQFATFAQEAIDSQALPSRGKLTMPILAVIGKKSFGSTMAAVTRAVAADVTGLVNREGRDTGRWRSSPPQPLPPSKRSWTQRLEGLDGVSTLTEQARLGGETGIEVAAG